MILRPARPDEAVAISALALRSKAYWGYDQDFLDACRDDLTVDPAWCDGVRVVVAERGGVLGFARVAGKAPDGELADLFVDSDAIGQGVGRQLLQAAVEVAKRLGMRKLSIDSDPHAEGFYRKAGAQRVGETPSGLNGRMLPRLEIAVS